MTGIICLFASYGLSLLIKYAAMRPVYIWQYPEWPDFKWDVSRLVTRLSEVRNREGVIKGMMSGLGLNIQSRTALDTMTEDILRSNEIEGVILNSDRVRSSIARHLGIDTSGLPQPDHYTEGVVQVMMDAVRNNDKPLTHERLFNWHAAMFPTGRSGIHPITVGAYRTGSEPMQIVSGAMGKEKVHYEAPPSDAIPAMMNKFVSWVNSDNSTIDPVLKAATAHLWFVVIHPFDDGNGRLARTITDMLLAKADGLPLRFYSMSSEILREKKSYYTILEKTTTGTTDITAWIEWFLQTMSYALNRTEITVKRIIKKSSFWQQYRNAAMNERQVKIVNMLWDGFTGKLTSSKWAKITKVSQATALRDITDLINKGILVPAADGGRSTNYLLNDNTDETGQIHLR